MSYLHEWHPFTDDEADELPVEVDAALALKSPLRRTQNETTRTGTQTRDCLVAGRDALGGGSLAAHLATLRLQ